MENNSYTKSKSIASVYQSYHYCIFFHILQKIKKEEDAKDLTQDVFLRLMEYKLMLKSDTIKFFIFSITRNLVTDYLRRHYKKIEITSYIYDCTTNFTDNVESELIAKDLLTLEKNILKTIPSQRRKVYIMSRYEEKTISEISAALFLSPRTIENHLCMSRKEIRRYIKRCI
ncbi:MAG: sigma-70 family RNA polymerase sigma factor [Bacteroides sp.]|jgi:RNA polymerase sigma-70 factor (ECF subfamily)|nr:sigma-70 family RNA polymerase sigma factor [Bacteroides sp.]MCI1683551.1 sigma-70 family RNA polymerase sigma factor [Bacteroides sp.]